MPVITLIILLLILGVALFFLRPHIQPQIMTIIVVLIALGVLFWLLDATGVWSGGFKLE